jgi:capsular polysaccharide transport system permease protein
MSANIVRPSFPVVPTVHKFRNDLFTQWRVVGALLIREVYTRFGREGLGFGWIVAEPLVFAIPVLLVWSIVRHPFENGVPLVPLLWSGYLPLLLYRHVGARMLLFVRVNAGLLYHRQVTIFDIFLARFLLEVASNLSAVVASGVFFYSVGLLEPPRDLPMFYLGYLYMIWWCAVNGLIIGALSERTDWTEKIWQPYSYLYMFFSGFFYMAGWLGAGLREWSLCLPSLQAYEMLRAGMFGPTVKTYGDPAYETASLAVLTLIGLLLMRESRKYVVAE